MSDALTRYLPRLVIAHHGGRTGPAGVSEQHLDAAVMLADVSGFTALAERLAAEGAHGAEELTRTLNAYFGPLIDRILASGGDVVKFAGDALLVLWPVNGDPEDAVWRAAHCARRLQDFSEREQSDGPTRLSLKVCVGLGAMRLSHVGGRAGHFEVLVTGSALEPLAGISHRATPGKILLTEGAAIALGPRAQVRPLEAGTELVEVTPARFPAAEPLPAADEQALRGHLPPSVLGRLGAGEAWLGELRTATVLFVNFPQASYQTPLERAQAIMEVLQATLARHEGVLNKLSCDEKGVSMVAAFGLPPLAHEDDPARAVLAALSMHTELNARGVRHAIGLATGRVFCGVVGSPARCEYTVMGDTVNLAARLMQAARDDVFCDEATFARAQGRASFEALPLIPVKGKAEPVAVFRPVAELARARAARSEVVGRLREREEALAALRRLAEGSPGAPLVIEGEPGIGKSCLAGELLSGARELGLRVLTGAADPVNAASPYHALAPVLEGLLGLDDAPGDRAERARTALGPLAPLLPLVAPLLGLDVAETAETSELSGALRAERTRALWLDLLRDGPARLLLVEDAHWLDSASWAVLLGAQRSSPRACVALTTRPPIDPPAELRSLLAIPGARHLRLDPLGREDVLRLACLRLGIDELPAPAAELLLRRGGGHPYFTEELARALRDSGRLRIVEGRAELTGSLLPAEAELPSSVEGVVTSRVDRLPPAQQLLLKSASAIGRSFALELLTEVYPLAGERARLSEHLAELCRLDLLEREEEGYRFKHALTREAVYALVLRATRRELHRSIALALEQRADATAAVTLAHHWNTADEPARAAPHLERAGARALESGAYREALGFLRQALEHAPPGEPVRLARIRRLIGEAWLSLGDLQESRAELEKSVALLGHPARRPGVGQTVALVGRLVQRAARHVVGPARLRGDREARLEGARAYERLGQVCFFANEPISTLYASAAASELAEPLGPGSERARAFTNLCMGLSLMPLPPAARVYERRVRAELEHGVSQSAEAWSRMGIAMVHAAWGQTASARSEVDRAYRLSDALGDRRRREECGMIVVTLDLMEGRDGPALSLARNLVAEGMAHEDVHMQSGSNAHAAVALLRLGRLDDALAAARRASLCADVANARAEQIYGRGTLALVSSRLGDRAGAVEAIDSAVAACRGFLPTAIYALEGYAALAEAALELWLTEPNRASQRRWSRARAALATYARTFPVARPRLQWLDARAAEQRGRTGAARRLLAEAAELAEKLGQVHDATVARDLLDRVRS
jgi:class 3 adenylate cyclase/tetratricopeptide (TPR) repeat protein